MEDFWRVLGSGVTRSGLRFNRISLTIMKSKGDGKRTRRDSSNSGNFSMRFSV